MDLFIVNRYLGDNAQENAQSDEKAKLAKLLRKVEERRQKKAQHHSGVITANEDYSESEKQFTNQINGYLSPENESTSPQISPMKKNKKVEESILNIKTEEQDSLSPVPSTKKRKKGEKGLEGSLVGNEYPTTVLEISPGKKRKKKCGLKTDVEGKSSVDNNSEIITHITKQETDSKINAEELEAFAQSIKSDTEENNEQLLHSKQKKKKSKIKPQLQESLADINQSTEELQLSSGSKKKRHKETTLQEDTEVEDRKKKKKRYKETMLQEDTQVEDRKKKKHKQTILEEDAEVEDPIEEDQNKHTLPTSVEGFTIIGDSHFDKKQKVKRVLPQWLAKPSIVAVNLQQLTTTIKDIPELDRKLVRTLKRNKITHFFPVQAQVIPFLLAAQKKPPQYWPNDVCVSAPTGSGKTLAFVLPIVQALQNRLVPQIRALVVLPVQDLAVQVYKVFCTYTERTNLRVLLLTGQNSFQLEQQQLVTKDSASEWHSLVDILVTTPGRLVDHLLYTPGISLQYLRFLVIDEADRIIDNVQNDWLYHLESRTTAAKYVGHAPPLNISTLEAETPPPQKLLFSATLTQDPEKLQQLGLFQPKLFTSIVGNEYEDSTGTGEVRGAFVGKYTTPAELTEQMCVVTPESKPLVLHHLVSSNSWKQVLVFVGSQKDAHRLSLLLSHLGQGQIKVSEVSSALPRQAREKILTKFTSGEIHMLVSSDALARGMDIPGVNYVVLYNMPKSVKNYIHRVGRTGRAGRSGTAITLLQPSQVNYFKEMLRSAGKEDLIQNLEVDETELENLEEIYKSALELLRKDLERETVQRHRKEKLSKKQALGMNKLKKKKKLLKNGALIR